MNLLAKAISIAAKAFENKLDKGGNPYILHCLWVMNNVRHLGEDAMICAVLHDLIEDTSWSRHNLLSEGFLEKQVATISVLTHHKDDETYEEYIKKIANNELARQIKLKDLEHNMKPSRMKGLSKKDFDRIEKYHRWYTYLSKV